MGWPIHSHALLGDGRSAALVARDGTLTWLCWPRFDSPALFAGLLDEVRGGTWHIRPTVPAQVERRYHHDSNVLRTTFLTAGGSLTVTDAMPVAPEREHPPCLHPEHELVRYVSCDSGEVEVEVFFAPRPDWGRARAPLRHVRGLGWRMQLGRHLLALRTDATLHALDSQTLRACIRLRAGEARHFSLTWAEDAPAVLPPLEPHLPEAITRTDEVWRRWAARLVYRGPHREAVVRSALALKLLVFSPSGAVVAAATTSLPERPGGSLNWDYRFCWLRDAAFTTRALYGLGMHEEAEAFVSWALHATRLTRPELRVLYDVYGRLPSRERILGHLVGHAGSHPVRVGNAACTQLQLDCYGEVIDATTQLIRHGGHLDRETRRMLRDFGEYVCHHWQEPDSGIWEMRGPRRHWTHSKVLCWVALDRLLELHGRGALPGIPREDFERNRRMLRDEVEERCWDATLGSYIQTQGSSVVDASLLLLSWYGYMRPDCDRQRATWRRIDERLRAGDGLLYRYEQSRPEGEGAFAACGFWEAEYLARGGGTLGQAREVFDKALRYANDVGLFAEEVDPRTGDALGNFPQAFTHVGVISAALALEERAREERTHGEAPLRRHEPPNAPEVHA